MAKRAIKKCDGSVNAACKLLEMSRSSLRYREALDSKYRAARLAGGLRIPASACRGAVAGEAVASGSVKPHEATSEAVFLGAATKRIPEITEERLYTMAKSADELAEQLRSLQARIRESGLY